MKAFKKTGGMRCLLLLISILLTTGASAQWDTIYSKPGFSGDPKSRIQFFGQDTAFAMFNDGKTIKTINAGTSWITIDSSASPYSDRDLYFCDRNNGFNVYSDGITKFRKTTDGGLSWSTPVALPNVSSDFHIYFISPDTGFVSDQIYLIRTTDGGATWNLISSGVRVKGMFFTSHTTGYAAGYGGFDEILKTTDAGASWTPTVLPYFTALQNITFTSPSTGFACGINSIFKTVNAGATWTRKYNIAGSPMTDLILSDIDFPVADTGYALGASMNIPPYSKANIFRTTDGGESWRAYGACNTTGQRIHFQDTRTGYLITDRTIEKTTTGGFSCPGVSVVPYSGNLAHAGDSLSFYADPTLENNYAYSWTPSANMSNPDSSFTKFSTSVTGVLTPVFVTLTDTISGCADATGQGSVYTFPAFAGIVSAGRDTAVCGSIYNSFTLTATTNWDDSLCMFTWEPGSHTGQTMIVNNAANASYIVHALFPDGTSATDTVVVTVRNLYNDSVFHCTSPVTVGVPVQPNSNFSWNNGDTTNIISVNAPGSYTCIATYSSPGCVVNNTFTVVDSCTALSDVWPGDSNKDLIVNNYDVLNIGLAYGDTGAVRPGYPYIWAGQPMTDWPQFFSTGINYKHADCNGDGAINIADDTIIDAHYNYTHPPSLATHHLTERSTANLYLVAQYDTVGLMATVNFAVMLGTTAIPIDSIYGIAYSLSYDEDLTYQPMLVNYNTSWFGDPAANIFSFAKSFHSDGYIDLAVCHNDHANVAGSGQIGNAIIVTTDNVSGIYSTLHVDIYDVIAVTASGDTIPLTTAGDSVVIFASDAGVSEQNNLQSMVNVYPNPSNGTVNVYSTYKNIQQINVYNTLGRTLYTEEKPTMNTMLDLSKFENGIYIVSVKTDRGIVNKRIAISK